MGDFVKIAISFPEKEFQELEKFRMSQGLNRSKFILHLFEEWKKEREHRRLIARYMEGYRNNPEDAIEVQAWETASLTGLNTEEW